MIGITIGDCPCEVTRVAEYLMAPLDSSLPTALTYRHRSRLDVEDLPAIEGHHCPQRQCQIQPTEPLMPLVLENEIVSFFYFRTDSVEN